MLPSEGLRWEGILLLAACGLVACAPPEPEPERSLVPTYNIDTGRLEQIASDRNGDGKPDAWAYMDGTRLERVELDRDGDGVPDRIEYYDLAPPADGSVKSELERAMIARAEEIAGPEKTVTRREFYERGVLQRVEEDTDADGLVNRWEEYVGGVLVRTDLDSRRRGSPDRRLIYAAGGVKVEIDPDGDGVFEPAPAGQKSR